MLANSDRPNKHNTWFYEIFNFHEMIVQNSLFFSGRRGMGMETHGRAHSPLGPAQDRPHQSPSQAAATTAAAAGRLPRRRAAALGAAAAAGRGRGGGGGGQDEVQPERALKRLKGF